MRAMALLVRSMSLYTILKPHSIAVIGASRASDTIGHQIVANLVAHGFTGPVYPVNPHATSIHSMRCYSCIADVPAPVDMAVIAIPKALVLDVADQCGRAGVRGIVVISAGFREVGGDGPAREHALAETVRSHGMRMIGPNCLGVLNTDPMYAMDATFAPCMPPTGRVGFVSQSGALGLSVLDYANEYEIGIAQFVSVGNSADVSVTDVLLEWELDPTVQVVLVYQESFGEPRRFLDVASRVTRGKPVIVLKAGRSAAGARAASSHTGALAASDAAVDALLAQAGVLRAGSIEELFDMAMAFGAQPLPRSRRTAVITNSGGPGILAADALAGSGLDLAELQPATIADLRSVLPAEASVRNPLDTIASARPAEYRAALETLLADQNVDSVLSIFVPPLGVREVEVAEAIGAAARTCPAKPVLAVLMGRDGLPEGRAALHERGIPAYVFPESAARALAALCRYRESLNRPVSRPERLPINRAAAGTIIAQAALEGRVRLDQAEALALIDAYGISIARPCVVHSADAAASAAASLGVPVALKVISPAIVHKTEVAGVRLGIAGSEQVRAAYAELLEAVAARAPEANISGVIVQPMVSEGREMIAGIVRDPLFGPLLMFGLGGILVEALHDVTFRLAPITAGDASAMITSLRSSSILSGLRGQPPADTDALVDILRRLSQLSIDFPAITELDVNPLVARPDGAVAVDARVSLRPNHIPTG